MSDLFKSNADQVSLLATFAVREMQCGLDATEIQEVIRLGPLTPVRQAPPEVAGILNLRGRIVTIIDVGLRLGFAGAAGGGDSRIIIMEQGTEYIGLLVDRVDGVVEVEADQWERPPANVSTRNSRFFKAVCRTGQRVVALLDAGQMLAADA
jgi:purine-binding chemotaxis protein CheW